LHSPFGIGSNVSFGSFSDVPIIARERPVLGLTAS
jgi:hypothetical protein